MFFALHKTWTRAVAKSFDRASQRLPNKPSSKLPALFCSVRCQASCRKHSCIVRHHSPRQRLQAILSAGRHDEVEQDLVTLCQLFRHNGLPLSEVGVTGSLLIGAQQAQSDTDLVFYDRDSFQKARAITADLIANGQITNLDDNAWQEAYARRSCALSLEDYVWHERRKFNKGLINGRKFDLNFVAEITSTKPRAYQKYGERTVRCKITEDKYSFDYPAVYGVDHDSIGTVVCFIATYTGQAIIGESVEISGLLERADDGSQRIVVGSSREAPGEYIKVIHA